MKARYSPVSLWFRLRATYWFVPSLMTLGAIALALLMTASDRRSWADGWLTAWVYSGGADGARALLSAVAGSMITVVSLTFSVTIVALTVTSQHFGPRLLNSFMRDLVAQVVLGAFIGTFAYCLLVLRTVQVEGNGRPLFVPHLAVTVSVGLTLLSVAALIAFIHHISVAMQVSTITTGIARDLRDAIERLYPERIGAGLGTVSEPREAAPQPPSSAVRVESTTSGYVQGIDPASLMTLARRHDVTIWIDAEPGAFVVAGQPLVRVLPAAADPEKFARAVNDLFVLGHDRTTEQDAGFAIQQLVEVALHALSPGMNEPFTAITCIDRLGEGLALLATRPLPSPARCDEDKRVRVVASPPAFDVMISEALTPIGLFAGPNPAVHHRLLDTLALLARAARQPGVIPAVRSQAHAVWRQVERDVEDEAHRMALRERYLGVLAAADERQP